MRYFAFYDDTGTIVTIGAQNGEGALSQPNATTLEIDEATYATLKARRGSYLLDGVIRERPPMPSPYHVWDRVTKEWLAQPEVEQQEKANEARLLRDRRLADSDWTDTLSAKTRLGDELYDRWQAYRQALRDVPQQAGFPLEINWPESPA